MSDTVIAEFHAAKGRLADLTAALGGALVETRAYDGCLGLEAWLDPERDTIMLTEQWVSHDHYDRYLAWRRDTGVFDVLAPMLEGGVDGFVVRKCVAARV